MNETPSQGNPRASLPPWSECELFCINGYSGAGGQACGWRGRLSQAGRNKTESTLVCPSCGHATLLRIPPESARR
ncbi:MAG: hypothetical protein U1F83_07970 [Verrucomicrobiota bacterium]